LEGTCPGTPWNTFLILQKVNSLMLQAVNADCHICCWPGFQLFFCLNHTKGIGWDDEQIVGMGSNHQEFILMLKMTLFG
jgi:hypothetical protein